MTNEFVTAFCRDCESQNLRITEPLSRRFIAALQSKRFLILTGLAGSGKTKLAQAFAQWITPTQRAVHPNPFFVGQEISAVRSIYTILEVDPHGLVFLQGGEGTKSILPLELIRVWAEIIAENGFDEGTPAKTIQTAVTDTNKDWSGNINSFHSPLKALALHYLQFAKPTGDITSCYSVVPVGADWMGNENILGYPDGLQSDTYVTKPALELIRHALQPENAALPHFLILDEMNLSHVERYFADVLSAIESGAEIPLYEGKTRHANGQEVPQRIALPDNLFIIGTVNVDETTYMFSPKVLDRANVLEFRVEPEELATFLQSPNAPNLAGLSGKGAAFGSNFVAAAKDRNRPLPENVKDDFEREMLLFFGLLREHNAEFGYRTSYEAARFVHFYHLLSGSPDDTDWFRAAMDAVIVQKFLPKLHGSRSRMEGLLWALAWACGPERTATWSPEQLHEASKAQDEGQFSPEVVWNTLERRNLSNPVEAAHYPLSFEKVMRMWRKLVRDQFVSFPEA